MCPKLVDLPHDVSTLVTLVAMILLDHMNEGGFSMVISGIQVFQARRVQCYITYLMKQISLSLHESTISS